MLQEEERVHDLHLLGPLCAIDCRSRTALVPMNLCVEPRLKPIAIKRSVFEKSPLA